MSKPKPVDQLAAQRRKHDVSDLLSVSKAGDYAEDRFYIRSQDGERQLGKNVQVWFPGSTHARIAAVSHTVPHYRSMADMIRDAVHHRLHWLEQNYDADTDPATVYSDLLAFSEQVQAEAQDRIRMVEGARKAFDGAIKTGDPLLLRRIIDEYSAKLDDMSPAVREGVEMEVDRANAELRRLS